MQTLRFISMIIIVSQTLFVVTISWFVLDCQFTPKDYELHEVTLLKILYLYDPEACEKIYFYNITIEISPYKLYSNVVWPTKNSIAAGFRSKIKIWLSLHICWAAFAIGNVIQGRRPCSFYAILLPQTVTGVALLVLDIVNAVMFLYQVKFTQTEPAILWYLTEKGVVRSMSKNPIPIVFQNEDDTSWVPVLLGYISVRGIVLWLINFWMIKDNYFAGLASYRAFHEDHSLRKRKNWDV